MSSLLVRTSENCYWLAGQVSFPLWKLSNHAVQRKGFPKLSKYIKQMLNWKQIAWILNVVCIMFPKAEREIVNKILRLGRAIVNPVQIRSNAISCYLIAVNNCIITKAFSIVNSCMAFYSHVLSWIKQKKATLPQKSLETKPAGTTTISTNLKWDETVITCWLSLAYAIHKNRIS